MTRISTPKADGRAAAKLARLLLALVLIVFVVVVSALAGPPYTTLECREDGYTYSRAGTTMPLKHPERLCEAKRQAASPLVFDLRVHLEQKLGLTDYTYDTIPPVNLIILHQNGTERAMTCTNAIGYLRDNRDTVDAVSVEAYRPGTMEWSTACERVDRLLERWGDET